MIQTAPDYGRPVMTRYLSVSLFAARPEICSTDSVSNHALTSAGVLTSGDVVVLEEPLPRCVLPNRPVPAGLVAVVTALLLSNRAHIPTVLGQAMLVPESTA